MKYICAYRKNVVSLQRVMYLSMHEFLHTRARRECKKKNKRKKEQADI